MHDPDNGFSSPDLVTDLAFIQQAIYPSLREAIDSVFGDLEAFENISPDEVSINQLSQRRETIDPLEARLLQIPHSKLFYSEHLGVYVLESSVPGNPTVTCFFTADHYEAGTIERAIVNPQIFIEGQEDKVIHYNKLLPAGYDLYLSLHIRYPAPRNYMRIEGEGVYLFPVKDDENSRIIVPIYTLMSAHAHTQARGIEGPQASRRGRTWILAKAIAKTLVGKYEDIQANPAEKAYSEGIHTRTQALYTALMGLAGSILKKGQTLQEIFSRLKEYQDGTVMDPITPLREGEGEDDDYATFSMLYAQLPSRGEDYSLMKNNVEGVGFNPDGIEQEFTKGQSIRTNSEEVVRLFRRYHQDHGLTVLEVTLHDGMTLTEIRQELYQLVTRQVWPEDGVGTVDYTKAIQDEQGKYKMAMIIRVPEGIDPESDNIKTISAFFGFFMKYQAATVIVHDRNTGLPHRLEEYVATPYMKPSP